MDKKAVDSLISVLSNLYSKVHSLEQQISIAKSLLREHAPELHEEYLQASRDPQFLGFSGGASPELQELRKDMLRGSDEEVPS